MLLVRLGRVEKTSRRNPLTEAPLLFVVDLVRPRVAVLDSPWYSTTFRQSPMTNRLTLSVGMLRGRFLASASMKMKSSQAVGPEKNQTRRSVPRQVQVSRSHSKASTFLALLISCLVDY